MRARRRVAEIATNKTGVDGAGVVDDIASSACCHVQGQVESILAAQLEPAFDDPQLLAIRLELGQPRSATVTTKPAATRAMAAPPAGASRSWRPTFK